MLMMNVVETTSADGLVVLEVEAGTLLAGDG